MSSIYSFLCLLQVFFTFQNSAFAHKSHSDKHVNSSASVVASESIKKDLFEINKRYVKNVRSVFFNKCFDCHSTKISYPWYYEVPGAQWLIDSDMIEAKKHLDMSSDFPFTGHGTPKEDLEAIQRVVEDRSMPPLRYWILHWQKRLNKEEQVRVLEWTKYALQVLTGGLSTEEKGYK